jgi:hypothetical protein
MQQFGTTKHWDVNSEHLTISLKKINGANPQCRKTVKAAIHYSLNQELKFLYVKKQKLNEQLYKIHLEYASSWQNICHLIKLSINNKLRQQIETHYTQHNKTLFNDYVYIKVIT